MGMCRNVHFNFGGVEVYLQVHVIENPAYDILLGRPFDVLVSAATQNYSNDTAIITIRDPNAENRLVALPTQKRGKPLWRKVIQNVPALPAPEEQGF
jgi:hypothetical protein